MKIKIKTLTGKDIELDVDHPVNKANDDKEKEEGGLAEDVQAEDIQAEDVQVEDVQFEDVKVKHVKQRIEEHSGVPPEQQRLIFCGRQLHDEQSLREAGVIEGSVLHMVLALRGGK